MQRHVAHYRVSTNKLGAISPNLDAQRTAVTTFIKNALLLAEFVEAEISKKNFRPSDLRKQDRALVQPAKG